MSDILTTKRFKFIYATHFFSWILGLKVQIQVMYKKFWTFTSFIFIQDHKVLQCCCSLRIECAYKLQNHKLEGKFRRIYLTISLYLIKFCDCTENNCILTFISDPNLRNSKNQQFWFHKFSKFSTIIDIIMFKYYAFVCRYIYY